MQNIYDTHGNLIAVNDKVTNTTIEYTLDKLGNTVLQADVQHGLSVLKHNTFDADNNNTSTEYTIGSNSQSYTYLYATTKPESVFKSVTLPTTAVQSVEQDNLDRVHEITLTSGTKTNTRLFHYLKNGLHTSNQVSSIWFGDNDKYLDNLKYKYDEKDNITEIYENLILVARYKYDSLSRIVREDNKCFNKTTTWEYDAGGNILNRFEYEFTTASDLSEKAPTAYPYKYATSGIRDRLMEYNGESFVYDAIGNPTTYRGNTLVWDKGRQLKSYGSIAEYSYNANGIRVGKKVGATTTQYFLDGTKTIAQKDIVAAGNNTTTETLMQFIYGVDGITGFMINNQNYYYKKNAQNDIIGIYNDNLQIIAKYDYDAWGNCKISYLDNGIFVDFDPEGVYNTSNTSLYIALKNPFRYRSYYYDQETKLYYLNSRYYSPEIGRFINIDDISVLSETQDVINGINLFAYCNNNPIMFADETGYFFWFLFIVAIIAGAIISAGADIISQWTTKGWNNINWGQVGWSALTGALGGALMASGVGALGMAIFGGALGFVDSLGYQLIGGANFGEINWLSVGVSTFFGAMPGLLKNRGVTNAKVLDAGLEKSSAYLKAAASYDKVLTKIATGQYKNLAGAAGARAITVRNLQKAWNITNQITAWNKLTVRLLRKLVGGSFGVFKDYFISRD